MLRFRQSGNRGFRGWRLRSAASGRSADLAAQRSRQPRQQAGRWRRRIARRNLVAQDVQFIECCLDEAIGRCRPRQQAISQAQQQRLQVVTEITHGEQARHPGAALQRVQAALQFGKRPFLVLARGQPGDRAGRRPREFRSPPLRICPATSASQPAAVAAAELGFRRSARFLARGLQLESRLQLRVGFGLPVAVSVADVLPPDPSVHFPDGEDLGEVRFGIRRLALELIHRFGRHPRRASTSSSARPGKSCIGQYAGPAWTPYRRRPTPPTAPPPVRPPGPTSASSRAVSSRTTASISAAAVSGDRPAFAQLIDRSCDHGGGLASAAR